MRKTLIAALALAALPLASMASELSDSNPNWNGCLIVRQVAPNGAPLAINRVCAAPQTEFSLFEGYQLGQRPSMPGSLGPTSLDSARMIFNGLRSRYADSDSRLATLRIEESGAAGTHRSSSYNLKLSVDREAVISLASGTTLVLRMDATNQPTGFDQSLTMPTWSR